MNVLIFIIYLLYNSEFGLRTQIDIEAKLMIIRCKNKL